MRLAVLDLIWNPIAKLVLYNLPVRLKNASDQLLFVIIRVLKQRVLIRQIPLGLGNIIYSGCRESRLCLKNALSFEFIRVLKQRVIQQIPLGLGNIIYSCLCFSEYYFHKH
jgi:hypothetical protein